jgi:gliding motility-associated-like protein
MLRQVFLILFILNAVIIPGAGQKSLTFQKKYGGKNSSAGCSVIELKDKGYLIAGATDGYGAGGLDILVIRTDSTGKTVWSRTFGGSGDEGSLSFRLSWAIDMIQTADSNFIVCTNTQSFGAGLKDYYLVKFDINGNVKWARTFGGTSNDFATGIINFPKKGLLIAGQSNVNFMLLKLNDAGLIQWAKTYRITNSPVCNRIRQCSDGNFLLAGDYYPSSGPGVGGAFISKIDTAGNMIWAKSYGIAGLEVAIDVLELPDKSIYFCGRSGFYPNNITILTRLDKNGKKLWSRTWGGGIATNMFYNKTKNEIYICGDLINSGSENLFLLRTDTSGKPIELKYFGNQQLSAYTLGEILIRLSSGDLLFLAGSYNALKRGDIILLKTDPVGNTNACFPVNLNITMKDTLFLENSLSFSPQNINPDTSSNIIINSPVIYDSLICMNYFSAFTSKFSCGPAGYPVQFSDSSNQAISWRWDFGDTGSSSNTSILQNPVHLYKNAGAYKVKLVSTDGTNSDSIVKTIYLNPGIKPFTKDTSFCYGRISHVDVDPGWYYRWTPDLSPGDSTHNSLWFTASRDTIYSVKVYDKRGCFIIDSFKVHVDTSLKVHLQKEQFICPGSSILLKTGISDTTVSITWQDGSHLPVLPASKAGTYWVKTSKKFCTLTDTAHVYLVWKPVASIGDDTTICKGDAFTISLKNLPLHTKVTWQNNSDTVNYNVSSAGKYAVKLANECGVSLASIQVGEMDCFCSFIVPKAFSPNKDSLNNIFIPVGCPYKVTSYNFKVYNRWGELVFETSDKNTGWDGKFHGEPCPVGVYIYIINYKHRFEVAGQLTGTVTLVK